MSLYIYTYGDTGIPGMDSSTGSTYFRDPGVDRYHLNQRNIHIIVPCSWSHAVLPSVTGVLRCLA